jgi:peptide deformylase
MAVLPILKMGDPLLFQVAEPVREFNSPELDGLVADLVETMASAGGVGIAAPQVGVSRQVAIFGFEKSSRYPEAPPVPMTVLINPVITPLTAEEEEGWEGCLSVPGLRGVVPRWKKIRYQGFDPHGQAIDRTVEGFHARVVQHECDHLMGKLFPMRVRDFTRFGFTEVLFPEFVR